MIDFTVIFVPDDGVSWGFKYLDALPMVGETIYREPADYIVTRVHHKLQPDLPHMIWIYVKRLGEGGGWAANGGALKYLPATEDPKE